MLFNTTGEAWGQYAKWNKPFRKTTMAWFHLYEVSKVVKCVESKTAMVVGRYSGERPLLLFSRSVMSDSLWPHGLQHNSLPCFSPSPRACSNSFPSSLWCHPTISSFVVPFSSCLQSLPASGSFPMSQVLLIMWLKYWSFSFNISPSNEYSGLISFRIHWFDLLQYKGLSRVFSNTTVQRHQFFGAQLSL